MTNRDSSQPALPDEAQRLSRVLYDLQLVLRSHREILRQRGMALPGQALTKLEDAQIRLEGLVKLLRDEANELRQLRALAVTTAMINSTLDLDSVLNRAMETVIELSGAERGYLMLRNETTGEMEFRVAANLDQATIEQSDFMISRSVVNSVAETGRPVVTTNAQSDPRFSGHESVVSFSLRSILCVPLMVKDEVTGVIYADNRIRASLFGESELALLTAFANQASVAIENARLFVQIRQTLAEITEIRNLMDDVFTSIPSGVFVANGDNQITTHNPAAGEILNLDTAGTAEKTIESTLPTLSERLGQLFDVVRQENRRTAVELIASIENRGNRNISLRLSPLKQAGGISEGVAVVMDDLTEQRHREAQLKVVRRYLPPAMVDNIQSIAQLGLGGVRRSVTVLYVDVRPIDTFSDKLSPQDQMAALNKYVTVCSEPIHRYGGVIDKFMGTEVMALFNTQLNPSQTHTWDAIRAAADIVSELHELYRTENEPAGTSFYRIGVHSGIATMGNVGSANRREFTAIGDTVNVAHRLLDMAECGEVLLSHDSLQACEANVNELAPRATLADRGQLEIRGRKKPVRIYQLQQEQ